MRLKITCAHCQRPSWRTVSAINRATRAGMNLYCDRQCAGLAKRKPEPTEGIVMTYIGELLYTKPTADDEGFGGKESFSTKQYIRMNVAFARAMLKARRAGLETSFSLGPMPASKTDFLPTHIDRPLHHSGMGSCAADCAELGLARSRQDTVTR